jgi:hypothetical protein
MEGFASFSSLSPLGRKKKTFTGRLGQTCTILWMAATKDTNSASNCVHGEVKSECDGYTTHGIHTQYEVKSTCSSTN